MVKKKYIILLTNDDGINAPCLTRLSSMLSLDYEVYTIAPQSQMSAASHSLSLFSPISARIFNDHKVTLSGSPVDCINFGVLHFLKGKKIDLIVSGINAGPNVGDDLNYSGTFAAAAEGALFNINSIAVSTNCSSADCNFDASLKFVKKIVAWLLSNISQKKQEGKKGRGRWHPNNHPLLLNINIPALPEKDIKGYKWTKVGKRIYNDIIKQRKDAAGNVEYRIMGCELSGLAEEGTDIKSIDDGYITISPINLDFTDYKLLNRLKNEVI